MNTEELTQIATAHQSAISRHDHEMAEIRAALRQGNEQHNQEMAALRQAHDRHNQEIDAISRQQALNAQGITELKASILELRNIVADYIQERSQTK